MIETKETAKLDLRHSHLFLADNHKDSSFRELRLRKKKTPKPAKSQKVALVNVHENSYNKFSAQHKFCQLKYPVNQKAVFNCSTQINFLMFLS